jgi:adenylate cyclase
MTMPTNTTNRNPEWARALVDWLLSAEARSLDVAGLASGLIERLFLAGLPLDRLSMSVPTKHPELYVLALNWRPEAGLHLQTRGHDIRESATYLQSPVLAIHAGTDCVRRRLDGAHACLDFAVCEELAREGFTDYAAFALAFSHQPRSFVSLATRHPDGFAEEHLRAFARVRDALTLRVEVASLALATESLLEVYLGRNAARRVLAGAFMRGSGEVIPAAIFFCDMRGFTAMADTHGPEEVVRTLDALFDLVAAPIQARGGEILKFIGDAVLAVFTEDAGGPAACRAALEAALGALEAIARWNEARGRVGAAPIGLGIALHRGEVFYGNIGAQDRLDFTVIGTAVNEASRVESLCKTVGVPLLLTGAFRDALPAPLDAELRSLGRHGLRGVAESVEIFTAAPHPRG